MTAKNIFNFLDDEVYEEMENTNPDINLDDLKNVIVNSTERAQSDADYSEYWQL